MCQFDKRRWWNTCLFALSKSSLVCSNSRIYFVISSFTVFTCVFSSCSDVICIYVSRCVDSSFSWKKKKKIGHLYNNKHALRITWSVNNQLSPFVDQVMDFNSKNGRIFREQETCFKFLFAFTKKQTFWNQRPYLLLFMYFNLKFTTVWLYASSFLPEMTL